MVQGDGVGHVALVFFGLGAIQSFIGNFVDPKISASRVKLSPPVVVLVATAFWGWLWGATGVLLAVPLTVAIAGGCERFERPRWIAVMLGTRRRAGGVWQRSLAWITGITRIGLLAGRTIPHELNPCNPRNPC